MTFQEMSKIVREYSEKHFGGPIKRWSTLEWAGAMCGEAGEAANIAKKLKRIDMDIYLRSNRKRPDLVDALKKEIGDTYIYLDLLAQREGLTVEQCIRYALKETAAKEGLPHAIP